ncbi:MAG: hypothetical protein OXC10_17180 [Rhodospirillaceae bacterium]|nr:hypothetical protein [Rhodospirillaceae bacterium]
MGRDEIKIVEFDGDDDRSPAGRPGEKTGMKIVEFDNDREDGRKTVATAQDIGHIKIVEFDDDSPSGQSGPSRQSGPPEPSRPAARAIKIRDFGADAEAGRQSEAGKGPKIKVMEFD